MNENSLVEHRIMLPPGAKGTISYIAPSGHYNINEEVIEVEFAGTKKVRLLFAFGVILWLLCTNLRPITRASRSLACVPCRAPGGMCSL